MSDLCRPIKLSEPQCRCLIAHMDGPQQINVRSPSIHTSRSLLALRLLRADRCLRSKRTFITERGRRVLAAILAIQADQISETLGAM